MPDKVEVLSWLHIGDLHITQKSEKNYLDLLRIVSITERLAAGSIDFAVLPGDSAEDGAAEQFALVRDAVAALPMPLHIVPGDHDFKPRTLAAFHDVLGAERLPKAVTLRGHRCVFLDVVSAGAGGPDFRLGHDQLAWLERELGEAEVTGQGIVVFMHTYPADLREGADRLGVLLSKPDVTCLDMGHTHYNELANDGSTIFMATRSTGQIEEGPPGFSIAAIDGRTVSWRFKPLDSAWPFVLITHPADRRLTTQASRTTGGTLQVRAKVLTDAPVAVVEMQRNGGPWTPMQPVNGEPALWQASTDQYVGQLTVRARDAIGRQDEDQIEPAGVSWVPPRCRADGSDFDRIDAWPAKGIVGTQLGPNRNGRKW